MGGLERRERGGCGWERERGEREKGEKDCRILKIIFQGK